MPPLIRTVKHCVGGVAPPPNPFHYFFFMCTVLLSVVPSVLLRSLWFVLRHYSTTVSMQDSMFFKNRTVWRERTYRPADTVSAVHLQTTVVCTAAVAAEQVRMYTWLQGGTATRETKHVVLNRSSEIQQLNPTNTRESSAALDDGLTACPHNTRGMKLQSHADLVTARTNARRFSKTSSTRKRTSTLHRDPPWRRRWISVALLSSHVLVAGLPTRRPVQISAFYP